MKRSAGTSWVIAAIAIAASTMTAVAGQPFMKTVGRTTQPVGHYEFCRKLPAECQQRSARQAPIELSRRLWSAMIEINNTVNSAVAPRTDMEIWGREEVWSYPVGGQGDCEDYALEKRRRLMTLGIPAGDLLMTVVRQPNGDGHAVLTMRTSLGDFVLDNLEARILPWTDTEYTFLKRQSEVNSGAWVKINDGRADAVASTN